MGEAQGEISSQVKFSLLLGICLASVLSALAVGGVPLSLIEIVRGEASKLDLTVFSEIRAPRVILAATVGASLAVAGAVLQGFFRNPLADPGLIGVSGGAALGAVAMIVLGSSLALPATFAPYTMPLAAILGSLCVTGALYLFSAYYGQFRIVTVLLVGIAINALSSVGIGIFQYISNDAQLRSLIFWMMGSFGRAHWVTTVPCVLAMVLAVLVLITKSNSLDKLQLGENEAFHLGVDVKATKRDLVLLSAVCVGAGVAVSGIIGFVGLIVPHIVRFTIGVRHKPLMIGSALTGGSLMVLADLLARIVALPAEVPVGLVTSAIGAPFFLWLITKVKP